MRVWTIVSVACVVSVLFYPWQAQAVVVWNDWTAGNEVICLREQRGHLYVGTPGGLVVWDVARRSYEKYDERDGLANNWVNAVAAGPDGEVWIGNMHGLSRLRGGVIEETPVRGVHNMVSALDVTPDGTVWVGTYFEGLYWYDGKTLRQTKFGSVERSWVSSVVVDTGGTVWAGTWGQGLWRFSQGRWEMCSPPGAPPYTNEPEPYINDVAADPEGGVWVLVSAEPKDWLHHYVEGQWRTFRLRPGKWPLLEMTVDGSGKVWLLCADGLVVFDGQHAKLFSTMSGCRLTEKTSICSSEEGDAVWVGLCNDGVVRIQDYNAEAWFTDDPISRSYQNVLAMEGDTLWVGMERTRLASYSKGEWGYVQLIPGASGESDVKSIAVGPDGTKWVCSEEEGLLAYDGKKTIVYDWTNSPLGYGYHGPVMVDRNGVVWFNEGTDGLYAFDGAHWDLFPYGEEMALRSIYAMAEAPDGLLWFGGVPGACSFDGSTWVHYHKDNSALPDNQVNAIACSADGKVYFGTAAGVAYLEGCSWATYTVMNSGIAANFVRGCASQRTAHCGSGTAT